jgi:hypothetical protein
MIKKSFSGIPGNLGNAIAQITCTDNTKCLYRHNHTSSHIFLRVYVEAPFYFSTLINMAFLEHDRKKCRRRRFLRPLALGDVPNKTPEPNLTCPRNVYHMLS